MFKKRRSIKVSYNRQGLIHFICVNVRSLPIEVNTRILSLCYEVAGEHGEALYTMLTDDTKNVHGVAMQYYLSESQLYAYRKKFYEKFEAVITDRVGQI